MDSKISEVSLTYEGGWKLLHDIKWSLAAANCLRCIQAVLLLGILWTLIWKL